jgi:hypothetical protein
LSALIVDRTRNTSAGFLVLPLSFYRSDLRQYLRALLEPFPRPPNDGRLRLLVRTPAGDVVSRRRACRAALSPAPTQPQRLIYPAACGPKRFGLEEGAVALAHWPRRHLPTSGSSGLSRVRTRQWFPKPTLLADLASIETTHRCDHFHLFEKRIGAFAI